MILNQSLGKCVAHAVNYELYFLHGSVTRLIDEPVSQYTTRIKFIRRIIRRYPEISFPKVLTLSKVWRNIKYKKYLYCDAVMEKLLLLDPDSSGNSITSMDQTLKWELPGINTGSTKT